MTAIKLLLLFAVAFISSASADIVQQVYLKASNPDANDEFGRAVAVSGDTLVIGAPNEDSTATGGPSNNGALEAGAVYVFVRDGSGWTQQAVLKADVLTAGDDFGRAVAIHGNTLIVGAREEDSNSTTINSGATNNSAAAAGAAYVFVRNGTAWSQQAYLKASNTGAGDEFGCSVAVSGDTAIVGARYEDGGGTDSGAAYVFTRSGTSWTQQRLLRASDDAAGDQFGVSVDIDGDTALVGAHEEDQLGTDAGAAYVFVRSGTTWTEQRILRATGGGAGDGFGAEVAISGDSVVIRAASEDGNATTVNGTVNNSAADAGAAYVFVRSSSTWSQQAYLKPTNTTAGDQFGRSVDIDGDVIAVGAPLEDSAATGINGNANDNSATDSGAGYIFTRSGTTWTQTAYLKASNTTAGDNFGISNTVRIAGSQVIIAAPLEDSVNQGVYGNGVDNGRTNSGAAYVFTLFPWRQREPLPVYGDLAAVAVSNTKVVAVGNRGTIATSPDGEVWETARAPHWAGYRSVAFSTNSWPSRRWVAVGGGYNNALGEYEATVATASEGDEGDWRVYESGAASYLNAVAWNGTRFAAVGGRAQASPEWRAVFATSTDGWNWTSGLTPSTGELVSIAAGNGIFVAVGGTNGPVAYRSTDGSTWTGGAVSGAGSARMRWVGFVEGRFVATTITGAVFTSGDGISWLAMPVSLPGGAQPLSLLRATGRSVWLHSGDSGPSYSDDELAWSPAPGNAFSNPYPTMKALTFFNGKFIAVGSNGAIQSSPDAAQWRQVAGERTPSFSGGVAEKDGLWLAAGSYFNDRCLQASPDGIHWHLQTENTLSSVYDLKTALGRFIAVGRRGLFASSTNGVAWDHINIPGWNNSDRDLTAIGSGGGVLLAGGHSEIGLLRSTDALTCTRNMNPFPGYTSWNVGQILHGAGRFVIIGGGFRVSDWTYNAFIFSSTDGFTWTETILPGLGGVNFIGNSGTYAQNRFVILDANAARVAISIDGIAWTVSAVTPGISSAWQVFHDGKRFMTTSSVGEGGALWTSADGVTWTRDYSYTGPVIHHVHHHAGLTVALSSQGILTQGTPSLTPPAAPVIVRDLSPTHLGLQYPEGSPLVLSITATGRPAPQYQWTRNGQPLGDGPEYAGTQTAELTIRSLAPQHAGDYRVSVSNSGGSVQSAILSVAVASKQNQTITFDTLAAKAKTAPPFALTGISSSGLTVRYDSSDPTIATVRGGVVTLTGMVGVTNITAYQSGDGTTWRAAASVTRSLVVVEPNPEIEVTGNGLPISSGDSTPDIADHTVFSSATNGVNSPHTRTYSIHNSGTTELVFSGTPKVVIQGIHAGDFDVTNQPVSPVPPGGTTTVQITFNHLAEGMRVATVSIASNDADENPFTFTIQGTGVFTPGMLDPGFASALGPYAVHAVAAQADGKVVSGGEIINFINGLEAIKRRNQDGSLDTPFNPGGTGINPDGFFPPQGYVSSIAMAPDGKIFIGGAFTSYNGVDRGAVAKLNADGTLDIGFNPGAGANNVVSALAIQNDGKVIIAGNFTSFNGVPRNCIARLNANGTLDTGFFSGFDSISGAQSVALQNDGKILVAGSFTNYGGVPRNRIVRLNADGSLDPTFNPGSGFNGYTNCLAIQPDGKVLVAGFFTGYNGVTRNQLARLHAEGSLDNTFVPAIGTSPSPQLSSLALQADGKIIVGGRSGSSYTSFGDNAALLMRLNPDGSLDSSFDTGAGIGGPPSGGVVGVALQADGKVLVGGLITSFNGVGIGESLVRLANDPASQALSASSQSRVEWMRGGSAPEVAQVTFEGSADGVNWTHLGNASRIPGGWELTGLSLSGNGHLRARGRATGGEHNGSSSVIEQTATFIFASLPAISVFDGTDLPENALSNNQTNPVNFGSHPVPTVGGVTRLLRVKNTGSAPLTIFSLGTNSIGAFELTSPTTPSEIAPGAVFDFSVRFSTNTPSTFTGTVSILNNSPDNPTFTFPITATGLDVTPPFIQVSMIGGIMPPNAISGPNYAKAGAVISLAISSNEPISAPTVLIGGRSVTATENGSSSNWSASTTVDETFPQGPANISVTATDLAGNTANSVTFPSFGFPVIVDTIAPTMSPGSIWSSNPTPGWAKTGDTVTVTLRMSEEIVTPQFTVFGALWPGTVTNSFISGVSFTTDPISTEPEGPVAVSFQCADFAGNVAIFDSISFDPPVVVDRTPPLITQGDLKVEVSAPGGATATFTPSSTDALGAIAFVTSSPTSGSFFPLGSTPVSVNATDSAGNTATGSFNLTVLEAADFWRDRYFDQTSNNGAAAEGADPDKDGLVNLIERAFNMHPLQAGSGVLTSGTGTSGLPFVTPLGDGPTKRLRIEYLRRKATSYAGISYEPQLSTALDAGWTAPTSETVNSINELWERVTVEGSPGAPQSFGRVKVSAP